MHLRTGHFGVSPGKVVRLEDWPTDVAPLYKSKADYERRIAEQTAKLAAQQDLFYADHRRALLLIFQALDAAGKDGAIKHVMSGVNPQGCQVVSFKHPSPEELDHDFLWRSTRSLPARGMIGIFNRSYYEEVLIVRVHPDILAAQNLPPEAVDPRSLWRHRYESIVDLERHLDRNGTRVIKFFLHLSKREQRKRFMKRLDDPDKNWKFSPADMQERGYWKDYQKAYAECLSATSTKHAPWYVVPADDKNNARLIVSEVILQAFRDLDLSYPKLTGAKRKELARVRKVL